MIFFGDFLVDFFFKDEAFGGALLMTLSDCLGSEFDDESTGVWQRIYRTLLRVSKKRKERKK